MASGVNMGERTGVSAAWQTGDVFVLEFGEDESQLESLWHEVEARDIGDNGGLAACLGI